MTETAEIRLQLGRDVFDWYDLVWYAARHPHVNLGHLETRMRQSGDYGDEEPLTRARLLELLRQRVRQVDVEELREEVAPFVRERQSLEIWSQDFFLHLIDRIETGHLTTAWTGASR